MRNGTHLIAYVDRFGGGDLSTLGEVLTGPLEGVFTGVHVLPFYRPYDGADAEFDPVDHATVDPRLGDWPDVRHLVWESDRASIEARLDPAAATFRLAHMVDGRAIEDWGALGAVDAVGDRR